MKTITYFYCILAKKSSTTIKCHQKKLQQGDWWMVWEMTWHTATAKRAVIWWIICSMVNGLYRLHVCSPRLRIFEPYITWWWIIHNIIEYTECLGLLALHDHMIKCMHMKILNAPELELRRFMINMNLRSSSWAILNYFEVWCTWQHFTHCFSLIPCYNKYWCGLHPIFFGSKVSGVWEIDGTMFFFEVKALAWLLPIFLMCWQN